MYFLYKSIKKFSTVHILLAWCFSKEDEVLFFGKLLSCFDGNLAIERTFHAHTGFHWCHLWASILHHEMHIVHIWIILLYLAIMFRVFYATSSTTRRVWLWKIWILPLTIINTLNTLNHAPLWSKCQYTWISSWYRSWTILCLLNFRSRLSSLFSLSYIIITICKFLFKISPPTKMTSFSRCKILSFTPFIYLVFK